MINAIPAMLIAALTATAPDLGATANIRARKLSPGREYVISLKLDIPKDTGDSGVPNPLLQLEVPDCVKLNGKHLTTYKELARNEFLQKPYEQVLKRPTNKIRFKLLKEPNTGDAINLNIIAYVSDSNGENMQFIRTRLTLPIAPGAVSTPADAPSSQWGTQDLIQIGDEAPDFKLPSLTTGSTTLSKYRGKKNVIITTYRAHW